MNIIDEEHLKSDTFTRLKRVQMVSESCYIGKEGSHPLRNSWRRQTLRQTPLSTLRSPSSVHLPSISLNWPKVFMLNCLCGWPRPRLMFFSLRERHHLFQFVPKTRYKYLQSESPETRIHHCESVPRWSFFISSKEQPCRLQNKTAAAKLLRQMRFNFQLRQSARPMLRVLVCMLSFVKNKT